MAKVYLDGQLVAHSAAEHAVVDLYLEDHIALTRAEPGCLSFSVTPDPARPTRLIVTEEFRDRAAFEAHQARAQASPWAEVTQGIPRQYQISEDIS